MVSVGPWPTIMSFSPGKTHTEFAWRVAPVGPDVPGIGGVVSVLGVPGGALHLTRESGSCTCPGKGGGTYRNSEQ
jgi:hypothetical protein